MKHSVQLTYEGGSGTHGVVLRGTPRLRLLEIDGGAPRPTRLATLGDGRYEVELDAGRVAAAGQPARKRAVLHAVAHGDTVYVAAFGRSFELTVVDPVEQAHAASHAAELVCRAPMPGVVVQWHVAPHAPVRESQPIVTIESMKLLTVIAAPAAGTVERLDFAPGTSFGKGAVLAVIHAGESPGADAGQHDSHAGVNTRTEANAPTLSAGADPVAQARRRS